MAFVKFVETGRSFAPKASISTYGILNFNEGARKRFNIKEYSHCIFYYDSDTRRIGIELVNDETLEGARTIRHRATGSDVSAKAFIEYFKLHRDATMVYEITKDEKKGMLILDMNSGEARKRGRKK